MKFKTAGSGRWESDDGRWYVLREVTGRYDLYDTKRKRNDQLVGMNCGSVAECEEMARGYEWAERQEEDPSNRRKLKGHE